MTCLHLQNIVAIPMVFHFIQIVWNKVRKAEPYTFDVQIIPRVENILLNHVFKKVHPPTCVMSSQERPPTFDSLVGMRRTINM